MSSLVRPCMRGLQINAHLKLLGVLYVYYIQLVCSNASRRLGGWQLRQRLQLFNGSRCSLGRRRRWWPGLVETACRWCERPPLKWTPQGCRKLIQWVCLSIDTGYSNRDEDHWGRCKASSNLLGSDPVRIPARGSDVRRLPLLPQRQEDQPSLHNEKY
jgi:hypothetical protein